MALFKINKGLAENLAKNMPYAKEGFAYFTKDDGKFYIDIAGDGTTTEAVVNVNRIPLNAAKADVAAMIQATAMATDDNKVYPILAFNITDSTKNLVEAKYSQIGIKNGTLVIPSIEDKDEILISNEGLGRGIVIDNKGTNNAIEILNGKGIKVAQDPTDDLELVTKQYVDNQNVVLELRISDGSINWANQTSYDFTLDAKALTTYSRLREVIEKGYTPTVIIEDIDNVYIYKYSFTQVLIITSFLIFAGETLLSSDGKHMGRDFIAFQSNASGTTLTVQRLNKPLEYVPGDGEANQILVADSNGRAKWSNIPSIGDLGGATKNHTHDDRYYTENEINDKLNAINDKIGALLGANDALVFKGIIDGKHPLPTANYEVGHTYRVNEAGTYAGQKCEQGDLIICIADALSTNTPHWTVAQTNIDGAVIGPASAVNNHVAIFNGVNGKVIKDSGFTIGKSVPLDAKFTDTHYTTYLYAGTGTAQNAATTNGNTKLTIVDNTTVRNSVIIKGTGGTSVTSDSSGNITINSPIAYSHPKSEVIKGTYKSVTVDEYGHVIAGTNPTTLAGFGITDAKKIQNPVSSPSATTDTTLAFIDTISQDAQGVITATKKTVQNATKTQAGAVSTSVQTFGGAKTFASTVTIGESGCTLQYDTTNQCLNFVFA